MKRTKFALFAAAVLLAVVGSPAFAGEIGFFPKFGAPGDPVVITGEEFAAEPDVGFSGAPAEVVRATPSKILVLVPRLEEGEVRISVDGESADAAFTVLPPGAPVVLRMSAETVSPGTRLFLVGRRLGGGTATFVDADGVEQATVETTGRRRAIALGVPADLAPGAYTLVVENGAGLDTGPGSPEIRVVARGEPEIAGIRPEGQGPGRRIVIQGAHLRPAGPATVRWRNEAGDEIEIRGLSNGHDAVHSIVPGDATPGATYGVVVELRGGAATNELRYDVGERPVPELTGIEPDAGPPGSHFLLFGQGLLARGEGRPDVVMEKDGERHPARLVAGWPGLGDLHDVLLVHVPDDLPEGRYDVYAVVGDAVAGPVAFGVEVEELSVESMRPDGQTTAGTNRPVVIRGTGFGTPFDGDDFGVAWDDGSEIRRGLILFRSNRLLLVLPPGGTENPLARGIYGVTVHRGDAAAFAGRYTVEGE